jgi:Mn-dependent DtxR family transcriptional regulator
MTTVEIWPNGEHFGLTREQWEELTESVDGPVHHLDDELAERIRDFIDDGSTD